MARSPKPWFRAQNGYWCAYVNGRRVHLAKGKSNRTAATRKLRELLALADLADPTPATADPTVASLIDAYLTHGGKSLGLRTLAERRHYLQRFAEDVGYRKVSTCKPFHLTQWLDRHPAWRSDWTIATVTKIVQRAFNWAVRQGVIRANPFAGVTHRPGEPRQPIGDPEFRALLRAAAGRRSRQRPGPAARFRQFLIILRYTGC